MTEQPSTKEKCSNAEPRSWLSLVTFCAVTVLVTALGSTVLLAGASLAFANGPALDGADANAVHEIPAAGIPASSVPTAQTVAATNQPMATQITDDGGAVSGQTFAGMITDSHCGARHPRNSDKTSAECVRSCVRNGDGYVLVDGEKIYGLRGDPVQLEKMAGERVTVIGMREGNTIQVKTVTQMM